MLTRLCSSGARLARCAWRRSSVGRLTRGFFAALDRAWRGSHVRDAAGRPVTPVAAGKAASCARFAVRVAAAVAGSLHTGYLNAVPGSRAARWGRSVAEYAAAYPVAAAGLVLSAVPVSHAVAERWLVVLLPWTRWLDCGGPALGPAGLSRSVPGGLWPAVFGAGLALSALGWLRWPKRVSLPALARDSWSFSAVADLLYLKTGDGPGDGEASPGERPRGAIGPVTLVLAGAAAGVALYLLPVAAWLKLGAGLAGLGLLLSSTEWYLVAVAAAAPFLSSELLVVAAAGGFASLVLRAVVAPAMLGSAANPAAGPIVFFTAVIVFATATSVTPKGSLPDLAANLTALLFVVSMIAVSDRPGVPLRFAAGAAVGVALQGLLGLYQYLARIPVESAWVDLAQAGYLKVRVLGAFGNPNVFAEYLVLLLPLVVALFFAARRLPHRVLWLGAAAAGGLALLLTFSRGGWVGLAVAGVVFALSYDRRLAAVLLVAALVVVSLPAGQSLILLRLQSIVSPGDSSSAYRMAVWRETAGMIHDFWPSGVGLGHRAFMTVYPQYMHDRTKRPFHAHNAYLELLAETGVLGLLAFAWLVWRLLRSSLASLRAVARRPCGDSYAGPLRALLAGGLAALAGALVHGFVEPILYIPRVTFTFWFLVGVVLCLAKVSPAPSPGGAANPDRLPPAVVWAAGAIRDRGAVV